MLFLLARYQRASLKCQGTPYYLKALI